MFIAFYMCKYVLSLLIENVSQCYANLHILYLPNGNFYSNTWVAAMLSAPLHYT